VILGGITTFAQPLCALEAANSAAARRFAGRRGFPCRSARRGGRSRRRSGHTWGQNFRLR
jgi:hypothetical protein